MGVVYSHYVGEPTPYYADFYEGSTLDRLDGQLRTLAQHFEFGPLHEVIAATARSETARPLLAVTFDDGFDLISCGAMDVLSDHGVEATSFVITGTVGNVDLMWRNKLSAIRALRPESLYVATYTELATPRGLAPLERGDRLMAAASHWPTNEKEDLVNELWAACDMPPLDRFLDEFRPYFTWEGLETWLAAGHAVGLHTATHPFCSTLDDAAVQTEIVGAAATLRARLRVDFLPFSYPFGARLREDTERALYEAGVFDAAFGIEGFASSRAPRYRLERASIEGELGFSVFGRACLGLPRR